MTNIKRRHQKILKRWMTVVVPSMALVLASCGGQENTAGGSEAAGDALEICMPPWVNSPPQAYMTKFVIEKKFDKEVKISEADAGLCYASLAKGDHDIFADTWMPATHKEYVEKYDDDIEVLGKLTEFEPSGLFVPEYVTIDSMTDLVDYRERFDGKIVGIEPGSGIMTQTEAAIEEYDLDYQLVEASDYAMTASLKSAIESKEWVVATLWKPHWAHSLMDLKRLDDPKAVYGTDRWLSVSVTDDLEEREPEVAEFLNNWRVDGDVWNQLIKATAVDEEDPEAAVAAWADANKDIVDEWVE
jgi:glycine betaine/proline transport system substrate-binding protein